MLIKVEHDSGRLRSRNPEIVAGLWYSLLLQKSGNGN